MTTNKHTLTSPTQSDVVNTCLEKVEGYLLRVESRLRDLRYRVDAGLSGVQGYATEGLEALKTQHQLSRTMDGTPRFFYRADEARAAYMEAHYLTETYLTLCDAMLVEPNPELLFAR